MNEFSSLVKRSFEGLGYCCGDYEDAASAGLWMQTHGLQGLDIVQRAVQRQVTGESSLAVRSIGPGEYDIEASDASIVVCGYRIVELAACVTVQHGKCHIQVQNCRDRDSIIAAIASTAGSSSNPIAMLAHWQSMHAKRLSLALPNTSFPRLLQLDIDAADAASESALTLLSSRDTEEINRLAENIISNSNRTSDLLPRDKIKRAAADATEHGLSVDSVAWNELLLVAGNILVESTEQSRKGAGES